MQFEFMEQEMCT